MLVHLCYKFLEYSKNSVDIEYSWSWEVVVGLIMSMFLVYLPSQDSVIENARFLRAVFQSNHPEFMVIAVHKVNGLLQWRIRNKGCELATCV
jgi:hypothetical protein